MKWPALSLNALVILTCLGCSSVAPVAATIFPTDSPAPTLPEPSTTPRSSPAPSASDTPAAFVPPADPGAAHTQTAQAALSLIHLTPTQTRTPWPSDAPRLRDLAAKHKFYIGAAVQSGLLQQPDYASTVAGEFNILTPEYELKMCVVWPARERFDFRASDAIVQFAADHGMRVRGHTLVWTDCIPDWISKGSFSSDEAKDLLHTYISNVVGRYKGRIQYWDVLNETIQRSPIWETLIGPDYARLAFQWAHEADPDAVLVYNDYDAEMVNSKSDAIYNLVKGWKESGVPIGGVGLQAHFKGPFDADSVARNIARLNDLGLQVHITELDYPYPDGLAQPDVAQADLYGSLLKVCLQAANCPVFVMWGFTDRYSYLNGVGVSPNPLIFDADYRPKPAYAALYGLLSGGLP